MFIGDYNIARIISECRNTTQSSLFSDYTAPEILNEGNFSFASDMFSYGCFLYRAITGFLFF
jgi:serine/threonine protein kinase